MLQKLKEFIFGKPPIEIEHEFFGKMFFMGMLIGAIAYLTTKESTKNTKMMRSLYLPAVLWLIYAAWEFYARMQGANIRIDLLVIYPLLVTVTTIGFVLWFIGMRRGKNTSTIVE